MQSHSRIVSIERISLGLVWLSEIAGISQTFGVSPAWIGIPYTSFGVTLPLMVQIPFFLLWCLVQAYVTLFLFIQAYSAIIWKDRGTLLFFNAALVCTITQVFGFFHSIQLFGASVVLTDAIFLYIYKQNERNRNMSKFVAHARQAQSEEQ